MMESGMEYPQQTKIHGMIELMYRKLQKAQKKDQGCAPGPTKTYSSCCALAHSLLEPLAHRPGPLKHSICRYQRLYINLY